MCIMILAFAVRILHERFFPCNVHRLTIIHVYMLLVDPNAANANFGAGGFGGTKPNSTGTSGFDPTKLNQGFGSGSGFGDTR